MVDSEPGKSFFIKSFYNLSESFRRGYEVAGIARVLEEGGNDLGYRGRERLVSKISEKEATGLQLFSDLTPRGITYSLGASVYFLSKFFA